MAVSFLLNCTGWVLQLSQGSLIMPLKSLTDGTHPFGKFGFYCRLRWNILRVESLALKQMRNSHVEKCHIGVSFLFGIQGTPPRPAGDSKGYVHQFQGPFRSTLVYVSWCPRPDDAGLSCTVIKQKWPRPYIPESPM